MRSGYRPRGSSGSGKWDGFLTGCCGYCRELMLVGRCPPSNRRPTLLPRPPQLPVPDLSPDLRPYPAGGPAPAPAPVNERPRNQTDVYAVHGADPEVLAYAMAKYSRSSLSMKESLREISSQRAEQFLNTFYFQYGHRSIADLAHVAFAIERLSLLAAIVLVDEQRWDGQERSTRYQNFRKSGWYLPEFGEADAARATYEATIERLFADYHAVSEGVLSSLIAKTERPAEMKQETFERTLRARAFDVARYLLPLATNTSLGQIVNARTLETQVSRLLSDEHAEVRELGERLRAAGTGPAWNVHGREMTELVDELRSTHPEIARPCRYAAGARGEGGAHAGEVCGGESLPDGDAARAGAGRARADEGCAHRCRPGGRPGGTRCIAGSGDCRHAALWRVSLSLPPDTGSRGGALRGEAGGDYRPRRAPSRPPRRAAARLRRRRTAALRHPDGHRRLPRHAPASPLSADAAELYPRARF